jgi:hypothetical protein
MPVRKVKKDIPFFKRIEDPSSYIIESELLYDWMFRYFRSI